MHERQCLANCKAHMHQLKQFYIYIDYIDYIYRFSFSSIVYIIILCIYYYSIYYPLLFLHLAIFRHKHSLIHCLANSMVAPNRS